MDKGDDSDNQSWRCERMNYYRTCPICGAALDPGEKCECEQTADKEKMIAAITELMQGATMSELEFVLGYLTA